MAGRVRVQVQGGNGKSILLNPNASEGATIGKDLFLPNGQVATIASLAALLAGVTVVVGGGSSSINPQWDHILNVPANVTAVAGLSTHGMVRRNSDGTWTTVESTGDKSVLHDNAGTIAFSPVDHTYISDFQTAVRSEITVTDTATVDLTYSGGAISADVLKALDHTWITDWVTAVRSEISVTDTATVDLTYSGGAISADVLKTLDHTWITDFDTEAAGVAAAVIAATPLDGLSDVVITSPATNDVLTYNGSSWVNLPGGGYSPPVTTKGDLFGFDTGPARVPVGSDGKVLTADSGAALGVSWQPAGGGGSGTVTSVDFADASTSPIYTVSGNPITVSGTIDITLNTQTSNRLFAGPTTGSPAQPTFRAMVSADIPSAIVTYAKIQNGAANGVLGTNSGAAPSELTYAALTALLSVFDSTHQGVVAASGGGTTNFLRADGSWAAPPGAVAGANPTASVGLAAVNGSATTYLRSDGAPALDVSISPTWTGSHTFAAQTVAINSQAGGTQGRLTINSASATPAYTQFGINGAVIGRVGVAGATNDLLTGSAVNDMVLENSTASKSLLFGTNAVLRGTIDGSGRWTFAAPSATGSSAFTFNGINGNHILNIVQAAGAGTAFGVNIDAGTNASDYGLRVRQQGGTVLLTLDGFGQLVSTPQSGQFGLFVDTSALTAQRAGITFKNDATQNYLSVNNAANDLITGSIDGALCIRGQTALAFSGNGGTMHMQILGSTGAISGRGAVAAAQVDMTPDEAATTMTTTITTGGFTTALAFATRWVRIGDQVTMFFPSTTGTSAAGANGQVFQFATTQLPASIFPARTINVALNPDWFTNNTAALTAASTLSVNITAAGNLSFFINNSGVAWTAGGTKGINTPFCFTYHLF